MSTLPLNSRENHDIPDDMEVLDSQYLSSKDAVKFLLNGTLKKKVCRYCLNVASSLSELDMILQVAGQGIIYKVTIREMIASFHPVKVADDPNFPNRICDKCLDHTLSSYLYIQQCERSERALRYCFEDIYDKLEKLDPLEKQKKPGRQKSNPNYNVLYAAHEKVIDYAEPLITIVNTATEFMVNDEDANKKLNSNNGNYICPKCCQKLPSLESLLNHERSHPSSMLYHCHLCGKSFPKRINLRRHIHGHTLGKPVMENADFKCLDCNIVSKDYHTHLQHIEKHKFKEAMQHLLMRKTDKLCAVCLNNGMNLIELEDMVCLHGGYPEMMGDRTLYQILASTVPEKSSYKYRELLAPSQAKILTIKKLRKVKGDSKLNFILSYPYVISKEDISFDRSNQFVFNDPNKNLNFIEEFDNSILKSKDLGNECIVVQAYDEENEIKNVDDKCLPHDKEMVDSIGSYKDIVKFSRSNNVDSIKHLEGDAILRDNGTVGKSCKICWIFKRSSCQTCLGLEHGDTEEKNNSLQNKQDSEFYKQQCKFCWLFKNTKECEYCKKQNNETFPESSPQNGSSINYFDVVNLNVQDSNKLVRESGQNSEKKLKEVKDCDIVCLQKKRKTEDQSNKDTDKTRKQKILNETVAKSKTDVEANKSKWECKICLMMNTNRELCFCCDAPRTLNQTKFNFKCNKDFFKDLSDNKNYTGDSSKVETNLKVHGTISVTTEFEKYAVSDAVKVESHSVSDITEPFNTGVTSVFSCNSMTVDLNINVDNSINTQTRYVEEEMEIGDDTPLIEQSIFPSLNNSIQINPLHSQLEILPFQFNIGIATSSPKSSDRQKMRPRKTSHIFKKRIINAMDEEF